MGAIPMMKTMVEEWGDRSRYAADLKFLEVQVWPDIQHRHMAHDSYCCDQFPSTR
jgi:hypothetical protein